MTYFDAIILGILQGLTEFLPVSSSGHLVLAQALLDVKVPGVSFEIIVHLGSLLAVIVYFRASIVRLIRSLFDKTMVTERKMIWLLIIGTVPAVLAVLLFKDFFEAAFSRPVMTAVMLFVTGAILLSTHFFKVGVKQAKPGSAILMGIGQALAIIPGISRSGTTIAVGMMAGVKPSEAAEFSFLLAVPAILGAVVFKLDELVSINTAVLGQYVTGALVTFVASIFAVYALLAAIKKGKFLYFGFYCFAAGGVGLYLFL